MKNEEYEVVGMNHKEYQKQMEEQARKSKEFIVFKTFIGGEMDNPISSLEIGQANALQMIHIMAVLKTNLEELIKQYPELYAEVLRANIGVNKHQRIVDLDEEDIDDIN
jgi:hypothetical protein